MEALRRAASTGRPSTRPPSGRPFLGICVGMQLLFEASEEDARRAAASACCPGGSRGCRPAVKRPQMQWNRLDLPAPDEPLFDGPGGPAVGVLRALAPRRPDDPADVVATCDYGGDGRRRRRPGQRVRAPSSTPRSPAPTAWRSSPTSSRWPPAPLRLTGADGSVPGHRPPGGPRVRLSRATTTRRRSTATTPSRVAEGFAAAGAPWIHVVDLDAARSGDPVNRPVVEAITAAVAGRARVQAGGGVRSVADARALARRGGGAGGDRLRGRWQTPELVDRRCRDRARSRSGSTTAAVSWPCTAGPRAAGVGFLDVLGDFPAAEAFVVTDIGRDGTLDGPDRRGARPRWRPWRRCPVIASGGVASLEDLQALATIPGWPGSSSARPSTRGGSTWRPACAPSPGRS